MGKIIAITNRRGKVGKTTTAINLAVALALSNKMTLLIDLDASGSCVKGLGFNKKDAAVNLFGNLKYNISLKPAILKTEYKKLDFIHIKRLPYIDEHRVGEYSPNELILKNILKPVAVNYDYLIFDCPPHLSGNINAALIAADSVLIPVSPGKISAAVVKKTIDQIKLVRENYNPDLKIIGLLLTIYESGNEDSARLEKELSVSYPRLMLDVYIPKSSSVRKAFDQGKPLLIFNPDDVASKAYFNLAEEIALRYKLFGSKRNR